MQKKAGYTRIRKLREAKLIEPKGFYPTMGQGDKSQNNERRLSAYYSLEQKKDLKKLNLTKIDYKKYILKEEAIKLAGITSSMFENGTFTAAGKGLPKGSRVTEFYDRKIIINHHKELLKSLKIPGTNIIVPTNQNDLKKLQKNHNLLTDIKARKFVGSYLDPNLIKPIFEKKGFVKLYLKKDLKKIKNQLENENKNRNKYLSETEVRKKFYLKNIQKYREKKLITPDSEYFPDKKSRKDKKPKPLYSEKTIKNFIKKNNISIFEKKNYLNAKELMDKSGYTNIDNLYKNGLIKEVGIGITKAGFTKLFDRKIVKKIKFINKIAIKLGFQRAGDVYIKQEQFEILKKELNKISYKL